MSSVIGPRRRYALEPLFLIALFFALTAPAFWLHTEIQPSALGMAYENAELYQWIYPQFHYLAEHAHDAGLPLWNPRQLAGKPVLADLRNGLFQPLHLMLLASSTEHALALHAFLCLFLMGIFFSVFLRGLGLNFLPALLGGIVYAFSGASASAMSRPALAASLAWAPLAFWAVTEFARTRNRAWMILAGFAVALTFFAGSPALFVAVIVLLKAWFVFLHYPPTARRQRRAVAGGLLAGGVALGVTAIQWAPTLAWAARATYNTGLLWNFDLGGRLPANLSALPALLISVQDTTVPNAVYVGIGALLAAPAAFYHPRLRSAAWFFLAAAVCGLALASAAPGQWWFAFPPQAFAFAAMFALAALSAIGFDRLLDAGEAGAPARRWPMYAVVLMAAAAVFYVGPAQTRGNTVAFVVVAVLLLAARARWYTALTGSLFAVFLLADLFGASVNLYRHPYEDAPACYEQHAPVFAAAEERALGRRTMVSSGILDRALPQNLGMITPLAVIGGFNFPLTEAEAAWWRRVLPVASPPLGPNEHPVPGSQALKLLNMAATPIFLLGPKGPVTINPSAAASDGYRAVQEQDGARLIENEAALPRAYWTPLWREAANPIEAVAVAASSGFNEARECVVVAQDGARNQLDHLNIPQGPVPASTLALNWRDAACTIQEDRPERVTLRVNAPMAGIAVLADAFDPAWRVRVDGESATMLQANGIFRGVAVPAGEHEIEFRYEPASYAAGLSISLATLGLLGLFGATHLFRRRTGLTDRPRH